MTTEESYNWEVKWEATMKKIKNLMFQDIESTKNPSRYQRSMDKNS
jgi:hypothetical protein